MLSLAAKTHWKLAIKGIKKAFKVTLQDIKQQFKARKYIYKIYDDNQKNKFEWEVLKKYEGQAVSPRR